VLEPDEVERFERDARALGRKIGDAESLAQALDILDAFEGHVMAAIGQLTGESVYSYAELASGRRQSRQALRQRHARYLARPAAVEPPEVLPMKRGSRWRWRCRCAAWQHCPDEQTARTTAAEHAAACVIRPQRARTAHRTDLAS
jgi:hypothetical protein